MCPRLTIGALINTESAQFVKALCTVLRLNLPPAFFSRLGIWDLGNGSLGMGAWEWEFGIWELGSRSLGMGAWDMGGWE